jgi:hypothetical protein
MRRLQVILTFIGAVGCQQLLGIHEGENAGAAGNEGGQGTNVGGAGGGAQVGSGGGGSGGSPENMPFDLGDPTPLLLGLNAPVDLAVGDTGLYWLQNSPDDGAIGESDKLGNGAQTTDLLSPGDALAVDATDLFWLNQNGYIFRKSISGGAPNEIANIASGDPTAGAIANGVYFALDIGDAYVHVYPTDGGPASYVDANCIAHDMTPHTSLAIVYMPCDGNDIREVTPTSERVLAAPTKLGLEGAIEGVAMAQGEVFFVTGGAEGRLGAVSTTGAVRYLAAVPYGYRVAVDHQFAYVLTKAASSDGTGLVAVDHAQGNEVATLVAESADQINPRRIRVDDSGVYWLNQGQISSTDQGSIWQIPKLR